MTDKEKAIVMAYTGICMLAGDKLQIFHKYVEDIMGRPIWTHEMGDEAIANEIKEKAKADFIALCANESSSEKLNRWIPVRERLPETYSTVCATIKWDLCDLSSIAFGYYTKDEGWQLIDAEGNRCYDFTVIAWMPLQPYKEGSDKGSGVRGTHI